MLKYDKLSTTLQSKISSEHPELSDFGKNTIRRDMNHDKANIWRPAYIRDVEKIMHSLYYNRYADKTQVFSLYKNDDISHRGYHVQLVSRIARNIGRLLGLNTDLIEAIALGHDIGHTPFGHAGEKFLNELYYSRTGRYFNHNVHSVRVLDNILKLNLCLETLDGILCHNGKADFLNYHPSELTSFDEFDKKLELCYTDEKYIKTLVPNTLEGCIVRISDMIAYIGKDRQDAVKTHAIPAETVFDDNSIGRYNAAIINNLIVNIIENSYGQDCIKMDKKYFDAFKQAKIDNFQLIYTSNKQNIDYEEIIKPLFYKLYDRLLDDVTKNRPSPIFKHHVALIEKSLKFRCECDYGNTEPNLMVVDFIASMTDDYFIDLCEYFFGDSGIKYISYFNDFDK